MLHVDWLEEEESSVQWDLGVLARPASCTALLRHRFKSKVGGRPAWLDPVHLPVAQQLSCCVSGLPLDFLLQVYAPADHASPEAFHRFIYLFVSPRGDKWIESGAIRAFRSQLPRANPFYSFHPAATELPMPSPEPQMIEDRCRVLEADEALRSGQPIPEVLGVREFPEWELVIRAEEEPEAFDSDSLTQTLQRYEQAQAAEGPLSQEEMGPDIEATISGQLSLEQRHYAEFAARVAWDPDQVLRYAFQEGAEPLWPSSSPVPTEVPPCAACGGPRIFEFEVLPQLLNYLNIDHTSQQAPDYGAIAVYCCAASCSIAGRYAEEFVFVQPA